MVSYKTSILPLFTAIDIAHMGARGVHLDNYAYMSDAAGGSLGNSPQYAEHANARGVYSYLTGETQPQMPIGEAAWSRGQLDTYNQWMTDGFQP